ncbi:MAG: hypothetical protein KAR13_16955, partial [Desulfobulbaceae bacterium]|nr:hypothetical protein [Desulfobulbaceae bacterium]
MDDKANVNILYAETADDFLACILEAIFLDFHTIHDDNFDEERFPGRDPNATDIKRQVFFMKWLHEKYARLFQTITLLEDDDSKQLYQELIRFRIVGHKHVKLRSNTPAHWQARAQAKRTKCNPSQFNYPGQFGSPDLCTFTWNGRNVRLYTFMLGLAWQTHMQNKQYYFNRHNIKIQPSPGYIVIDGGACLGDTAFFLGCAVGDSGHVYCFDFAKEHLEIIAENIAINNMQNITVIPQGLSDHESEGRPISLGKIWPG